MSIVRWIVIAAVLCLECNALWSRSSTEGTLVEPKLSVAIEPATERTAALRKALVDIDARVDPADRSIIVMVDRAMTVQTLAEVLAAVRSRDDGTPLFPAATLGSMAN